MDHGKSETNLRIEQFHQAARQAGIRLTPQRLEIFRLVAKSKSHPDAEEIFHKLHPKMPNVSLDTVYRTLRMLTDLGLLTMVYPKQESIRFDANLNHHHHFVCIQCGKISDFYDSDLDRIPIPPETGRHGKSISMHIEVRGICDACLKQNAAQKIKN